MDGDSATGGSGQTEPQFVPPTAPATVGPGAAVDTTNPVWTRGVWFPQPGATGSVIFPSRVSNKVDVPSRPKPAYQYYSVPQLEGSFQFLDPTDQAFFEVVAKAGSNRATGAGLYQSLLTEAQRFNAGSGKQVSPFDLVRQVAQQRGIMGEDGSLTQAGNQMYAQVFSGLSGSSPSSSSGGYTGPVSRVTRINDADLQRITDSIASTVLGRAVTKDEYAQIAQKVRSAESANPDVSGGGGSVQTVTAGLSSEGRQDVIERALLQQDGAKEFTMATKFMDMFQQALQRRPDAAS